MRTLKAVDNALEKVEAGLLSITTILISVMLVSNAISRYFFNKSWAFTEEIGGIGIVILTFMGLGYAARQGMHIEMSGLYDLLPTNIQRILGIFINLISAIVLVYFTYLGILFVQHLHNISQVTTILRIPIYLTMLFVPIGFLLASIRYFINFGQRIVEKEE